MNDVNLEIYNLIARLNAVEPVSSTAIKSTQPDGYVLRWTWQNQHKLLETQTGFTILQRNILDMNKRSIFPTLPVRT